MHFTEKLFVYDGINSKRYDLRILHLDTEPITTISGTPEYQKTFYDSRLRNVVVGQQWGESPITTEIEFISDRVFSRKELREIEKWLFNKPKFCKLYIDKQEDEDIERIKNNAYGELTQSYIECVFYEASVIEDGVGVRGFKATMELSSPFAFQDIKYNLLAMSPFTEYTQAIVSLGGGTTPYKSYKDSNNQFVTEIPINIKIDNDIKEYLLPKIELEFDGIGTKTSGDNYLTITNQNELCKTSEYSFATDSSVYTDNTIKVSFTKHSSSMNLKKISSSVTEVLNGKLILDGETGMFYSETGTTTVTMTSYLQNLTDSEFLKLADGDNELTISIPTGVFQTLNFYFRQVRFIR